MIKIGVLGDTHGDLSSAQIISNHLAEVNFILHTGDYYRDAIKLNTFLQKKVIGVTGNCDLVTSGPKEEIIQVEGKTIYLTHGHLYGVKKNYINIFYRGKEVGADIVVFGHTHLPAKEYLENIMFFNPGSLSKPRTRRPTYGLIEIKDGNIRASIREFSL